MNSPDGGPGPTPQAGEADPLAPVGEDIDEAAQSIQEYIDKHGIIEVSPIEPSPPAQSDFRLSPNYS